jgi:hypothetical protein
MKKLIFTLTTISLLLVLTLTACSNAGANQEDAAQASGGEGAGTSSEGVTAQEPDVEVTPNASQEREVPQAMQLVLGTFMLEKTDHPVDAEQAAMLLPLWKAARSLSQSETVAAEELQAVVEQIEDTMTPAQLDLIKNKQLSFEDINSTAEELGLEISFGGFGEEISPEMRATAQAARESGQAPPGGFGGPGGGFGGQPPGGGAGPGGGGEFGGISPEQRQTAIAERGGFRQVGLGVPLPLLEAVIEFLNSKVQ